MRTASRIALIAAAASHLLAACAARMPPPADIGSMNFADTRPAALRVTVTGRTTPVLHDGTTGRLVLTRDGAPEPIGLDFENGALAIYDLPPDRYSIAMIGPLACSGLEFTVDADAVGVALGSIEANIFRSDPASALLSGQAASGAEIASTAAEVQAAPEAIGSQPVAIAQTALCHTNGASDGQTALNGDEKGQIAVALIVIGTLVAAGFFIAALSGLSGLRAGGSVP